MRRLPALAALALAAPATLAVPAALAPAASAHPLGNFSTNHLVVARVSEDRVDLRYVLDQAEIPTFQERGVPPARLLARKRAEVARGVTLTAGGRRVALRMAPGGRIGFPRGQGGLRTTRLELTLAARVAVRGTVVVRDATFPGRVGWKAVVVRPGRGTAVRSDVPGEDPTAGLRSYPRGLLSSPADRPVARLRVEPGPGTVTAPGLHGEGIEVARDRGAGDRLSAVFDSAAGGEGVLVVLLLAAFGWGALHALSPGHGKAMVAAYLIGTRGTSRHALALGLTVTATHTIGVFALGIVTLALSQYVLPEDLYPWLNLVSGLLVLVVGATVLRARFRQGRRRGHGHHGHGHHGHSHHDLGHSHSHGHGHGHGHHYHGHGHGHGGDDGGDGHGHAHSHHHVPPDGLSPKALLAMGASAGLIPCPSALVVLLGAIAQHEIALGLLLIVAFSAGLAATLTGLGIAVVHAARLGGRLAPASPALGLLPALSALVIVGVGVLLTARAVPGVL